MTNPATLPPGQGQREKKEHGTDLGSPYILSRINWDDPRHDPIARQFIPLKSRMIPDHPKLTLDSLHEEADSPVKGLVHRYPDKALFLRKSTTRQPP